MFSFLLLLALFFPGVEIYHKEREEGVDQEGRTDGVEQAMETEEGTEEKTTELGNPSSSSPSLEESFEIYHKGREERVDQEGRTDSVNQATKKEYTSLDESSHAEPLTPDIITTSCVHLINMETEDQTKEKRTEDMVETQEDDNKEKRTRKERKVLLQLASFEIIIGFSALITIHSLNNGPHQSLTAAKILSSLTLLFGFCLLFHILFMIFTKTTLTTQIHRTSSEILIFISITCLILTSLSPVILLPRPYYIIPAILVPVIAIPGFYFYHLSKTICGETNETRSQCKEQLKVITRLSKLNLGLASLSSSGLIGILFGSWTNASNHAHHPYVKTSVFCMFLSFISSLLLMFVCQMRVDSLSSKTREYLIKTMKCSYVFLCILLVSVALAVSMTFLKMYMPTVLLPLVITGIVWCSINFCTDGYENDQDDYQEEVLRVVFTSANMVTTLSFGVIMEIFGTYLGSKENDAKLDICMFFMASAFISSMVLMLLSYEAPKNTSMGVVFGILGCCAITSLAFGGLSIFFLVLV